MTMKHRPWILLTVVSFFILLAVPAAALETITLSDELIKATYSECGRLELEFAPLEGEAPVSLDIENLTIAGKIPPRCAQPQKDGEDITSILETKDGNTINVHVRLAPDVPGAVVAEFTAEPGQSVEWIFGFNAEQGEHFYGFGEKFQALDFQGRTTRIRNLDKHANDQDDPAYLDDRSYKTVPFFMSSRGYGFWLDDSSIAYFNMNKDGDGKWWLRFSADRARLYFFAGPRLAEVLERFTHFTGRPPLWPAWVFAPWKSRDVHQSRDDVEEDILRQRELGIAGSVIVIDSPWETCYNNYKFNEKQFKKPAQMLEMAHDNGYKIVLWITPMINVGNNVDMIGIRPTQCRNYNKVKKNNGFVLDKNGQPAVVGWWKGTGSMIDFTHPGAAKYWKKNLVKLFEFGADGVKIDDGESQFAIEGVYHDGTPGTRMQNYYSYLYGKYTYEAIQEGLDGDGVAFARSGMAGTQQFGVPWAGDNYADFSDLGLPSVVLSGLSMAMSGFPVWGHDIGGYITGTRNHGGKLHKIRQTPELFMRWTQFGALSPVMQMHTTSNKGAWDFGDEALDNYVRYARLHTQLFPYIHALNAEAARTGMPMIRPLPLLYQEQPEAHVQRFEYLFGPDLLAGPVVEEGVQVKEMYFPPGDAWVDFYYNYGKEFQGGTVESVPAPMSAMPLFVRKGAILPMLPWDVVTLVPQDQIKEKDITAMDDRLEVRVYPAAGAESSAQTTDGAAFTGKYDDTQYTLCAETQTPRRITWIVAMHPVKRIERRGEKIQHYDNFADIPAGQDGWSATETDGLTFISIKTGAEKVCLGIQ